MIKIKFVSGLLTCHKFRILEKEKEKNKKEKKKKKKKHKKLDPRQHSCIK